MSMFTPIGMGGHTPSDRKRQRRRRILIIVAAVVALLVLILAVWRLLFTDDEPTRPVACATETATPTPAARPLRPADLLVNVYNATKREGLAAAVAESLKRQGFQVAAVANDPLAKQVQGTGEIRGGPTGAQRMTLLQRYVPGSVLLTDARTANDVDLVLGERFQTITVPTPIPTPSPTATPARRPPSC